MPRWTSRSCSRAGAGVAELVFFSGTMDCGKSTLALQTDHNHSSRGRAGLVFTQMDRAGASVLSSRLGLRVDAIEARQVVVGCPFYRCARVLPDVQPQQHRGDAGFSSKSSASHVGDERVQPFVVEAQAVDQRVGFG